MEVITIGRSSSDNDIVINDKMVSGNHCQIVKHDNNTYSITDLRSRNGTYVNGKPIQGKKRLGLGDVVQIGTTLLPWEKYFHKEVPPPQPVERPFIEIPSNFNINENEQYSEVRKRGDDFSVGFFRKMGDNIGNHLGNTIGCIVSIIVIIIFIAIIGLMAKGCA